MPQSLTDNSTTLERMKASGVPDETVALFRDAYRSVKYGDMAKHPVFRELRKVSKGWAQANARAEGRMNTAPELAAYLRALKAWRYAKVVIAAEQAAEINYRKANMRELFALPDTLSKLRKLAAQGQYEDAEHASKIQVRRKLASRADFIEHRADGDWNKHVAIKLRNRT